MYLFGWLNRFRKCKIGRTDGGCGEKRLILLFKDRWSFNGRARLADQSVVQARRAVRRTRRRQICRGLLIAGHRRLQTRFELVYRRGGGIGRERQLGGSLANSKLG